MSGEALMPLVIRRAALTDAAAITQQFAEPGVYGGTLQLPYPSEVAWQKRVSDVLASTTGELMLVAERNGELVGLAGLHPVGAQVRRRHAMVLGITVSASAQGQGVGTALMAALCEQADRWLGMLRIELTVFADNAVAQRLYQKFGFEVEGRLRGYALRDGVYADVLAMARLHPTPPSITPRDPLG
jgi:L-phenylalanine/L-methionine N-acetyltransferase